MIHDDLQHLGLSNKEASVYLAALELGTDTVQRIAKKSGVKRATTYVILESLLKKGLVSQVEKDNKTLYVAESPQRLSRFLEERIKNLTDKKNNLRSLLEELKIITNLNPHKPIVRFFEGKEGAKSLMQEFISEYEKKGTSKKKTDDKLYIAYSRDMVEEIFPAQERSEFAKIRTGKKVKAVAIYNWKGHAKDTQKMSEGYVLPANKFPFPCDIAVYNDKIRLVTLSDDPSAIIIVDKNLAQGLRTLFQLAIQGAQKIK